MDPSFLPPLRPVQCSTAMETRAKRLRVHLGSISLLCSVMLRPHATFWGMLNAPLMRSAAGEGSLQRLFCPSKRCSGGMWWLWQRGPACRESKLCPRTRCSAHPALAARTGFV